MQKFDMQLLLQQGLVIRKPKGKHIDD